MKRDEDADAVRLRKTVEDAIYGMHNHSLDPSRPYSGQAHTGQGERGKTLVSGLTFRDVCDCFVAGWLAAAGHEELARHPDCTYNDIYKFGGECELDPLAVMQNMFCEMERRMGIYPNLPELETDL